MVRFFCDLYYNRMITFPIYFLPVQHISMYSISVIKILCVRYSRINWETVDDDQLTTTTRTKTTILIADRRIKGLERGKRRKVKKRTYGGGQRCFCNQLPIGVQRPGTFRPLREPSLTLRHQVINSFNVSRKVCLLMGHWTITLSVVVIHYLRHKKMIPFQTMTRLHQCK